MNWPNAPKRCFFGTCYRKAKLAKYLHEFAVYIRANAHLIPNYGERYRHGEAISSPIAESAVNQVVSKRMCKRQQMRHQHSSNKRRLRLKIKLRGP